MLTLKAALAVSLSLTLLVACSSSKTVNDVPIQKSDYNGIWTITDIKANVPAGYRIANLFDLAPHGDFLNSIWTLNRNGNGALKLTNGTSQDIYWALNQRDTVPILQFKKVDPGEKARNIETGYRLQIVDKLSNSFILQMPVPVSNTADGNIRLTFTKTAPAGDAAP
jgi:hypothetical protein